MLMIISVKSQAQKWMPGHITDVDSNRVNGFIRIDPPGEDAPIKGEGFIQFKQDNKAKPIKLSASDLKSFVVGRDSFVVAHEPQSQAWNKNYIDFVLVILDEDIKLYAAVGAEQSGGGGFGTSIGIGIGTGFGFGGRGGGFGAGFGGGVEIPLGGSGQRSYALFYYGANTGEMKGLNEKNFDDVMTDIMGDEPDVVDKIVQHVYTLQNIDKLITYFKQVQASHNTK